MVLTHANCYDKCALGPIKVSWFINSQSNISLLVSNKSWEETGRRNGGSSSASLQAFWLACVIWWLSSVTLCTCDISLMFLILQVWKGLWVQYILPATASCGGFGFVCNPQAPSGLKKHFVGLRRVRLSLAKMNANGVSPMVNKHISCFISTHKPQT